MITSAAGSNAPGRAHFQGLGMPLVIANEGKPELLDILLRATSVTSAFFNLFLYTNNYTPVAAMTISSFTKPTWSGYADQSLLRGTWNAATLVSGKGKATYGSSPNQWTVGSGGGTLYGYAVQSLVTSNMLWAELFATSRVLLAGDVFKLQPVFTDDTDPSPL